METSPTVKAYCLKVPKTSGEKAISLAVKLGLLNEDLNVQSTTGDLYVPLQQEPSFEHVAEFERTLPRFDILIHNFSRRVKPSRSLLEILGDRLPPHLLASLPRAIDFVGDIAIVEVPSELEAHKSLIGDAILEAHSHVRTVLAKASTVGGVYRLREYEVVAGSPNTETVHKEYGCRYHMDVRKVYFSPRLSYEHYRVASQVGEKETVIDMFAGIGSFSILIAKKHRNVKVYAVDINPDAVEYLEKNVLVNGVQSRVTPILGDAKQVIRDRLRGRADRVIMNLPEKAMDYLETACEAMKPGGGIIHYYAFAEGPNSLEVEKNRLMEKLHTMGRKVETFLSARFVREVAPFKWQIALDIEIH